MEKKKIALISLGCEKNLVDSEMILGLIKDKNVEIINDISIADIIIVNTCGFITSAKEEALNAIMDAIYSRKEGAKIIVCGCLVQRYLKELKEEIKEVDEWIPITDYFKFGDILKKYINADIDSSLVMEKRLVSTPSHLAYVRIGDGCFHYCAFCAIPLIRGRLVSRSIKEIVDEIKQHVKEGRKEICLISQDLSSYGYDIHTNLNNLLKEIVKIEGLKWVRLLYLYPSEVSDELIQTIKHNPQILPYFDIPLQHASNKILKYMRRVGTKEEIIELINKIKKEIDNAIIRTTMMVGFPHESEKDFNELLEFIETVKFNHLGAFAYSREEGTKSYDMNNQVPNRVKQARLSKLLDKQKWISLSLNKEMIGKEYNCIIESYNADENKFYGRTYAFAPDDIDGAVIISNNKNYNEEIIGSMVKVKITEADFYDLCAEFI